MNIALGLALLPYHLRIGILDLDVFGPSIPTLMGLKNASEPKTTEDGALIPLRNHGIPTMSMGYLIRNQEADTPIVWRGLMVQKAVQQLLFDVDWRDKSKEGLDVLVIDMPPGTGDVPLTLGQLVNVDGAIASLRLILGMNMTFLIGSIITSTPQDVSLIDVSKGISMFRKLGIPVSSFSNSSSGTDRINISQLTGLILNQAYSMSAPCPVCSAEGREVKPWKHYVYGPPHTFRATAARLGIPILAEIPVLPGMSTRGDAGIPYVLPWSHGDAIPAVDEHQSAEDAKIYAEWQSGQAEAYRETMRSVVQTIWEQLAHV